MYPIRDTLGDLNKNAPLAEQLTSTHDAFWLLCMIGIPDQVFPEPISFLLIK